MKLCGYCGRENQDEAIYCHECGTQDFKKPSAEVRQEAQQTEAAELPESEAVAWDIPTTCEWCGRENAAGAVNCQECGTSLERPKAKPQMRPKTTESAPVRWQFRTLTADEMKLDLVTLLTCQSIVEADVVVGELETGLFRLSDPYWSAVA